jgi:hypothetical protein
MTAARRRRALSPVREHPLKAAAAAVAGKIAAAMAGGSDGAGNVTR